MSALPPKADIAQRDGYVRFVPIPDKVRRSKVGRALGVTVLPDHEEDIAAIS
jgi:hypothetical protein